MKTLHFFCSVCEKVVMAEDLGTGYCQCLSCNYILDEEGNLIPDDTVAPLNSDNEERNTAYDGGSGGA